MARRRDPFLDDPSIVETVVELTCHAKAINANELEVRIVRPLEPKGNEFLDVTRFVSPMEISKLRGEVLAKAEQIYKKSGGFLKWLSKK